MGEWTELVVKGDHEIIEQTASVYTTDVLINGKYNIQGESAFAKLLEIVHVVPETTHVLVRNIKVKALCQEFLNRGCAIESERKVRRALFTFALSALSEAEADQLDHKIKAYISDPVVEIVDYSPEVFRTKEHQGMRTYVHPFELVDKKVIAVSGISRLLEVYDDFVQDPHITITEKIQLMYEATL